MEYEVKFACDRWQVDYIGRQLARHCLDDTEFDTPCINSIYFDTPDWRFAMDKASSDYLKTKIRVRWYSSLEDRAQAEPRFLEIKHKIGSRRRKHRLKLPELYYDFSADHYTSEQLLVITGRIAELEPSLAGVKLVPALYVSYHRRRFIEPYSDTRIALDSQIRGRAMAITSQMGKLPVELDQAVLEVKGQEEALPQALRHSLSGLVRKDAFSKYYRCVGKLRYYRQ